jgi:hypothetical protein
MVFVVDVDERSSGWELIIPKKKFPYDKCGARRPESWRAAPSQSIMQDSSGRHITQKQYEHGVKEQGFGLLKCVIKALDCWSVLSWLWIAEVCYHGFGLLKCVIMALDCWSVLSWLWIAEVCYHGWHNQHSEQTASNVNHVANSIKCESCSKQHQMWIMCVINQSCVKTYIHAHTWAQAQV